MSGRDRACRRYLSDKEMLVAAANFDLVEQTVLTISRCYFQTFAVPESEAWITAGTQAKAVFGPDEGPLVAMALLEAVQAFRRSRRTVFRFSNPTCPGCAQVLTETERQFMGAFRALRNGIPGDVHGHTMILCEGHDSGALVTSLNILIDRVRNSRVIVSAPATRLQTGQALKA